jgi:hypothetical protein
MLKLLLSNPYVALGLLLAVVASYGAVGFKAYQLGQDNVIAEQAKLQDVETRTRDAALAAASEAISKIEVRNVTIRQKAETITREVPVYGDCRHDPVGLQLVNQALGTEAEPAGRDKLPAADSADRR